jgi:sugar lactone lactonase YvrE
MKWAVCLAVLAVLLVPASARSFYEIRPNDPAAQYVAPSANDTAALQAAIDAVQAKTGQGIVFLAPGRYVLNDTVHIWPGIRLIGWGAQRPVLTVAASTPGFGSEEKVLLFFAGDRPASGEKVPDANPGTFYSALSNIDVEIGEGNAGLVVVRSKYAQHSFIAHSEMQLGSALAGIHESGNVIEDVRFIGGRYGLWTGVPSPGWQLTVIDSVFEGQREAAIREKEAGLTLIRPVFRKVPTAVMLEKDSIDELWVSDAVLEDISGPAFTFGREKTARNEINMERITCRGVPVFAATESGQRFAAPARDYIVTRFSHGLTPGLGIRTAFEAAPGTAADPVSDLKPVPAMSEWFNVREGGARGDAKTDDTVALQQAIASHRVLYFPSGVYRVSQTLSLKPDTVIIGLHPGATQILLPDGTPGFEGVGAPQPLIETPQGGSNSVLGIGLYTGGNNPRAVAALWRSGADSFMNDVRFLGGHGTPLPDGSREHPYNVNHSGDPDPARRWDSQYPSLWVTGGGTFLDIWTPSTFAQAGLLVSDTKIPGRVYQLSVEHHVRAEVQVRNAAHWRFYALQTEEERGESGRALPLEVINSEDILFANTHAYRVISSDQPALTVAKVSSSRDIRFRNMHVFSNSKVSFDASVVDVDRGLTVWDREFAALDINPGLKAAAPDKRLVKLAGGFAHLSGAAAGPDGSLYVADTLRQTIYRWNGRLENYADAPLAPVNLAVDAAGTVMAVSYHGKGLIYAIGPDRSPKLLAPQPRAMGRAFVLPSGSWTLDRALLEKPTSWIASPDGTLAWPVAADFLDGHTSWMVKMAPQYRAFQFAPAKPGTTVYICEEMELRTYAAEVGIDGSLKNWRLFAERGGEAVASDASGNVYIADGDVFVYSPAGALIDTITMPERATGLVFAGKTLFIPTRTAIYAFNVPSRRAH